MFTYLVAVIAMVVISSVALAVLLKRKNMLKAGILAGITLSSAAVGILFPVIYNSFVSSSFFFSSSMGIYVAFLMSLTMYIILTLVFSVIILMIAQNKKIGSICRNFPDKLKSFRLFEKKPAAAEEIKETYLDKILEDKLTAEKSVDTVGNTDKMGLEVLSENIPEEYTPKEPEAAEEAMSVNDYVDRAFAYKIKGDLEGAVQQYMHVLEQHPDNDLVFWVILDVCVLYKSLGQVDLARGILESYVDIYGGVMDDDVKLEIERNLLIA